MIRRSVKIQLVAFVVISLLGIYYVAANYVGVHVPWGAHPISVTMQAPDTGGIFTNAAVTERGVDVGRVGKLTLRPGHVDVELRIDPGHSIPKDLRATVANLSAVGEQYVDLEPQSTGGEVLRNGDVITADKVTVPLDDATLLVDLDKLVTSVDRNHLATVIEELGKGFDNLGPSLQALIDNGNKLTQDAIATLPAQLKLIDDSRTVLDTQNQVAGELKAWAATFRSFSTQLVTSDPALRGVLDNGVTAAAQVTALLKDNQAALPTLLGNLITFNQIQAVRLPYVKATLQLFPPQVAGGFFVTPGDGTAHFGMVQQNPGDANDQPSSPCTIGYESTKLRGNDGPAQWGGPANLNAYCQDAAQNNDDNRGSRFVPRPDNYQITNADPYPGPVYGKSSHPTLAEQNNGGTFGSTGSTGPGASAQDSTFSLPYDPTTGLLTGLDGKPYQLGYHGPLAPIFGSNSWEWLLLAPTMR
ncbi:MAG: phospholipid/cholesterol/gamma-HCH transport system substrate-binding protein [Frankiaceae bacterium]|nr:phospholipid/cholesterol/gamma-HCH transport system substrate-binding protein [Frankiaceae bacterium]